MSVREIPTKFKCSDGSEHATKDKAERQQDLLDATEAFREAKCRLAQATVKTQLTADGVPFDFGLFRDYWYIADWGDWPCKTKVSFFGSWDQRFSVEEDGTFLIIDKGPNGVKDFGYRVSSLFHHEKNADVALLECQEKWLALKTEQIASLEAKVASRTGR